MRLFDRVRVHMPEGVYGLWDPDESLYLKSVSIDYGMWGEVVSTKVSDPRVGGGYIRVLFDDMRLPVMIRGDYVTTDPGVTTAVWTDIGYDLISGWSSASIFADGSE